jgi:hypothetical protein
MIHPLSFLTLPSPLGGEELDDGAGPRYNKKAIDPGAQTERRGLAGPVRDLLGGETSPAAVFSPLLTNADFGCGFSHDP